MVSRTLVLALATVSIAGAAFAQGAGTAESYAGVVSGKDVYVRSGPSGDAYPCDKLSHPARVTVVGENMGWLKIVPPEGCYSLISKDYLKVQGSVGTATGSDIQVRAGSALYPRRSDVIQTKLGSGATVSILGEVEGFYKITPPPAAYLWISSMYVKRAGEADLTTQPVERRVATRPAPQPLEADKDFADFEAAEAALRAELQKPRNLRNVQGIIEQYKAIQVPADHPLTPYLSARLKLLQSEKELADDMAKVAELTRKIQEDQARYAQERAILMILTPATRPVPVFAAEGLFQASVVFQGGATGPKRFAVCDPDSRLITAYVQSTGGLDLSKFVGAQVGVIGKPKYDEQTRTHVIEVEDIIIVKPAPLPTPRPMPRVIAPPPAPAPAPVIEAPPPTPKPAPPPAPTPKPAPPVVPAPPPTTTKPAPATKPADPLPATGLPVVEPSTKPSGVRPEEFE